MYEMAYLGYCRHLQEDQGEAALHCGVETAQLSDQMQSQKIRKEASVEALD